MNYSVKFNGMELGRYLDVLQGFTPFSGTDWSPEMQSIGQGVSGQKFKYMTRNYRKIVMPFTILDDIFEKYDEIERILNVDVPKELIFEGLSDRFFYAIPSGDLEIEEDGCLATGKITWIVPDGLSYSVEEKEVLPTLDNGLTFGIDYRGTHKAYPIIESTTKSDNGFLGFTNQDGAILQFGNVNELNGENYQRSETLISIRDGQMTASALAGFTQNVATVLPVELSGMDSFGRISHASIVTFNGDTENVAKLSSRGTGGGSRWKGASITKAIGADSEGKTTAKNFHAVMKHVFMLGTPGQQGVTEFLITTKDKKNIACIIFAKNNLCDTCNVYFCVNGKEVGRTSTSAHAFPSINHYMTWNMGHHSITKSGDTVSFYFGHKTYTYRVPAVANLEAHEVSFYLASLEGYDSMTLQAIRGLTFRKDNVVKYRDVPNKFNPGDTFVADTSDGTVMLDKMLNPGLGALGNDWEKFYLKPGNNQIKCLYSGWATKPDFKLKYREVYL